MFPNTHDKLSREQLASIFQLFDAYIQYANCEGLGMPQVEAMACGVPIFSVDYSAMSEVVRKSHGYPIKVERKFLELETGAYRVYPDNAHTAKQLIKFFNLPKPMRAKKGFSARQAAEKWYNWDTVAKIWEAHFDSIKLTGLQGQWDVQVRLHQSPNRLPSGHDAWSNEQFVDWIYTSVLGQPERIHSHEAMRGLSALNFGIVTDAEGNWQNFTRDIYFDHNHAKARRKEKAERIRMKIDQLLPQDFIEVANE